MKIRDIQSTEQIYKYIRVLWFLLEFSSFIEEFSCENGMTDP